MTYAKTLLIAQQTTVRDVIELADKLKTFPQDELLPDNIKTELRLLSDRISRWEGLDFYDYLLLAD